MAVTAIGCGREVWEGSDSSNSGFPGQLLGRQAFRVSLSTGLLTLLKPRMPLCRLLGLLSAPSDCRQQLSELDRQGKNEGGGLFRGYF